MKTLILLSILAITGCSIQITPEVIDKHNDVCINNGSIKEITITTHIENNYVQEIKCTNGAIFKLNWLGDILGETKASE